jgi:hypothetical protein
MAKSDPQKRDIIVDGVFLGVMEFPPGTNPAATIREKFRKIFGADFEKHTLQTGKPGGPRSRRAKRD